jgi:hypothetical protein
MDEIVSPEDQSVIFFHFWVIFVQIAPVWSTEAIASCPVGQRPMVTQSGTVVISLYTIQLAVHYHVVNRFATEAMKIQFAQSLWFVLHLSVYLIIYCTFFSTVDHRCARLITVANSRNR